MSYIINPMWFYWLNVIDRINEIILLILILDIACIIVFAVNYFIDIHEGLRFGTDDSDYQIAMKLKKSLRICIITAIILMLLVIAVPSKETIIEMMIAKYATVENATWTVDVVKEAVDYIVQAIGSMK